MLDSLRAGHIRFNQLLAGSGANQGKNNSNVKKVASIQWPPSMNGMLYVHTCAHIT